MVPLIKLSSSFSFSSSSSNQDSDTGNGISHDKKKNSSANQLPLKGADGQSGVLAMGTPSDAPSQPNNGTTSATDHEAGSSNQRQITLFGGISTIISLMIGAGIFSTAGLIYTDAGSVFASFSIWVVCGLLGFTGALCYAELGTMIPGSGGEHQYILKAFGPLAAFVFDWTSLFILKPGTNAVFASAFGKYMLRLVYFDKNAYQLKLIMEQAEMIWLSRCIGVVALLFATAAVGLSAKAADKAQNIFAWGKIFALASIIVGGLVSLIISPSIAKENFDKPLEGTTNDFASMLSAITNGLWAYEGWNNLNIVAGDLVNPSVNLPKAIGISVGTIIFLYIFTTIGYFTTIKKKLFLSNETIGMTFANELFGNNYGSIVMALFVLFAVFGSTISNMMSSAELCVTIAEGGTMPKMLARKSKLLGTPMNAIIFQTILSVALTFAGELSWLIMVYTLPQWFFYGMCVCALFYLRWKEPDLERPYKVWVYWTPVLFLLACIVLVVGVFIAEWVGAVVSVSVMLLSIPVGYFFVVKPQQERLDGSASEKSSHPHDQ